VAWLAAARAWRETMRDATTLTMRAEMMVVSSAYGHALQQQKELFDGV
jgi:hypothetical protein